jgi:hypothetical protein
MTIEEIKEKKEKLAVAITNMVFEFEEATGTKVTRIGRKYSTTISAEKPYIYELDIEI